MKKQLEYHREAILELRNAADSYDGKVEGLGLEFLFEVRRAESIILDDPEVWPIYDETTRRYLLKRFPFAIVYMVSEEKISVVAVAHCKRKPGYWKGRLVKFH